MLVCRDDFSQFNEMQQFLKCSSDWLSFRVAVSAAIRTLLSGAYSIICNVFSIAWKADLYQVPKA